MSVHLQYSLILHTGSSRLKVVKNVVLKNGFALYVALYFTLMLMLFGHLAQHHDHNTNFDMMELEVFVEESN